MCIYGHVLHLHIANLLNLTSEATGIPASTLHRSKLKPNKKMQLARAVIAKLLVEDGVHPDDIALAFDKTSRSIYSWLAMVGEFGDDAVLLRDFVRSRYKL